MNLLRHWDHLFRTQWTAEDRLFPPDLSSVELLALQDCIVYLLAVVSVRLAVGNRELHVLGSPAASFKLVRRVSKQPMSSHRGVADQGALHTIFGGREPPWRASG